MIASTDPRAPVLLWIYAKGFEELELECARIGRRIARGRERPEDRRDLHATSEALAELRALYRAGRRAELELLADGVEAEDVDPDDCTLIQAEELLLAGCSLRTIPLEAREALRSRRREDWERVLDCVPPRFAGSGGDYSAPT